MICISLLFSFDLSLSLPRFSMLVFGIALFFATVRYSNEITIWSVLITFISFGTIMALIGLVGTHFEPPFTPLNNLKEVTGLLQRRIPGTSNGVINPNELAGVLCWTTPLMLSCAIGMRRRLWLNNKAAYIGLLASTIGSSILIVATSSRGGIFAFVASAMLVVAFFVNGRWRLVLAIGFFITFLVLVSYSGNLSDQDIVGDALGLKGRIEIWSRAILAFQDNPLTGLSINGFRRVVHVLYPLFGISADIDLGHAHNHVLQVAMDLGLFGVISYLALWIITVGILWATVRSLVRRRANHHPYYSLVAGLSGSFLAGWLFGLFDAVALGSRPSFMWWLLLAMTASTYYTVVYSGIHLRSHRRSSSIVVPERDYAQQVSPIILADYSNEV